MLSFFLTTAACGVYHCVDHRSSAAAGDMTANERSNLRAARRQRACGLRDQVSEKLCNQGLTSDPTNGRPYGSAVLFE